MADLGLNDWMKAHTNEKVETCVIRTEEYRHLLDRVRWLEALECAGVDNWEGIDQAHELYDNPEF